MNWEEEALAEEDLTLSLNNVQVSPGPEENSYISVLETSRGNVNSLPVSYTHLTLPTILRV